MVKATAAVLREVGIKLTLEQIDVRRPLTEIDAALADLRAGAVTPSAMVFD